MQGGKRLTAREFTRLMGKQLCARETTDRLAVQGLRWRAIAEKLPGRSESGCRNRWVRNQQRLLAQAGQPVQGTRAVCEALAAAGMMRQR